MNRFTKPSYSTPDFEGEPLSVKQMTPKQFSEFQQLVADDANLAMRFVLVTTLDELNEADYDDIPMSRRNELFKLIIKEHGIDVAKNETELKN